MEAFILAVLVIGLVIGAVVGYFAASRVAGEKNRAEGIKIAALEAEREAREREREEEKSNEDMLKLKFENLGNSIFDNNSKKFTESTLEPFQKQIENFEKILKEKGKEHTELKTQLVNMIEAEEKVSQRAYELEQALRNRSDVRGRWGEMTLQRIAELAGMIEYCDFNMQENVETTDGRTQRPDMVVCLPERGVVVVDAKTNLSAYLDSLSAEDEEKANAFIDKHVQNIKSEVNNLSSKAYWESLDDSPEFVVLFVPGDNFLSVALQRAPDLQEKAMEKKIIIATPNTLFALLRAVAFGWQQKNASENSKKIIETGKELYKGLEIFYSHFESIGKSIGTVTKNYNKAVGSFEHTVRPKGRRFESLGIPGGIKDADEVTETTRTPSLQDTDEAGENSVSGDEQS